MSPLTKILYLLTVLSLIGCAASGAIKKEASVKLGPVCYQMFTQGGAQTYGACNNLKFYDNGCAFAVAKDGQQEACSWVSATELQDNICLVDCMPTRTELVSAAITRCENVAKSRGVKAPCKVFAIDYNIIYEDPENVDFQ